MKNLTYRCHLCQHPYADKAFTCPEGTNYAQISPNKNCIAENCPGHGFGGLCISTGKTEQDINGGRGGGGGQIPLRKVGLCIFLMDASGSMGDSAYEPQWNSTLGVEPHEKNSPCEKAGKMSKREVMAMNAALGVFSLSRIDKRHDGLISITLYDHNTKFLFCKSISEITDEYGTPDKLAKYLLKNMKDMSGGTNINKALNQAESLITEFKDKKMTALGKYEPFSQTPRQNYDINTGIEMSPSKLLTGTQNIRVLLYTDGEHQPEYGVLTTPFANQSPNYLIGVYIGQPGQQGDRELRNIIKRCPVHGQQQYLVVSKPEDTTSLYGIFRMASGASGFCELCIDKGSDKPKTGADSPRPSVMR